MKMKYRRYLCLILLMALTVYLVTGCGSSASIKSSKAKILFALHDEGSSYLAQFMEVITEETSGTGVTFDVVYCEKNADKQRDQILEAAGKYQAEYIWNGLGKPSTVNAIILKGLKGHSAVAPRTDSIKQYFWDNNVDLNLVFCDFANWKDEEAYNKLEVFKKTNQQIDCVFANSDAMALGAIKWLKEDGYDTSKVLVAGLDCSADGAQAIVDGDMYMTVLQDTDNQAKAALKAALILASEGSIKSIEGATEDCKYIWIPFVPVDKSNVAQYM